MVAGQIKHIFWIYNTVLLVPLSMCYNIFHSDLHIYSHTKSIIRATTTAIEVLLTFIRFTMTYKTQRVFGDGIRSRISHMQTSTHLLYVFYRDGTLLFIPWVQTGCYWPNWWPIRSVSLVSIDHKTSGLELIVFKVFSCLQAISFFLNLPDAVLTILG